MAKSFHHDGVKGIAAAALVSLLFGAIPARAQKDSGTGEAVSLEPKAVSKLQVKSDPPEYPAVAKINFIQGEVRMRIFVSPEGLVTEVHVLKGHPFLAVAAIEAVRNWVYQPYRIGKRASEFTTLVSVHFALRPKTVMDIPPFAERDLEARVNPPQVVDQPADPPSDNHIRLRVLIDSEGHAVDTQLLSGRDPDARQAEQEVGHWVFRPAHWGTLPVPWYLEVDVPVHHSPA
jgi:TonB family protein